MTDKTQTEVVVVGAGPGGYAAAFRAADLGKKVVLIDKDISLGGVCLNRGCIPSKALLHLAKLIEDTKEVKKKGVFFDTPKINISEVREWKNGIISNLSSGISLLAKARKVRVITGNASFISKNKIRVKNKNDEQTISFENAIIATGSTAATIPEIPIDSHRIIGSKQALELNAIPKKILVVGGGYIGLELGSVYSALGSRVNILEALPHLLAGADQDLVKPLQKRLSQRFENIYINSTLVSVEEKEGAVFVKIKTPKGETIERFDTILISIGRRPNTRGLNPEKAGVKLDKKGFVVVNEFQRTSEPNIYAIGDVTGNPMLAHKASYEGVVASEHLSGLSSKFDARTIPAVVFTNPEIAWAGLTETEAIKKGLPYKKGEFPWAASGKAIALGFKEGKTKVLFDPKTNQVLGVGIVGPEAGNLISEAALAIEMGADAEDLGQTIHPHPTLSETLKNSAEVFLGTVTDILIPKNKKEQL